MRTHRSAVKTNLICNRRLESQLYNKVTVLLQATLWSQFSLHKMVLGAEVSDTYEFHVSNML